jgi:hypothetical protein
MCIRRAETKWTSSCSGTGPYTWHGFDCCRSMCMLEIVRSILERNLGDLRRSVACRACRSNFEPRTISMKALIPASPARTARTLRSFSSPGLFMNTCYLVQSSRPAWLFSFGLLDGLQVRLRRPYLRKAPAGFGPEHLAEAFMNNQSHPKDTRSTGSSVCPAPSTRVESQ